MKEQDKIERIFQEGFKDFKVQPDASVWAGIESNIPSNPSGFSSSLGNMSAAGKVIIGIVVASGIALTSYLLREDSVVNEDDEIKIENNIPAKAKVEEMGSPLFADSAVVMDEEMNELPTEVKKVQLETVSKIEVEKNASETSKAEKGASFSEVSIADMDTSTSSTEVSLTEIEKDESNSNTYDEMGSGPSPSDQVKVAETSVDEETEANVEPKPAETKETTSSTDIQNEMQFEEEEKIDHVIPNIFTPNKDGMNDVFRIETKNATDIEVAILDKSGKIVFEWQGLYGFWDGNLSNGEPAETGNYFYRVLLIKDDMRIPKTGWVLLER